MTGPVENYRFCRKDALDLLQQREAGELAEEEATPTAMAMRLNVRDPQNRPPQKFNSNQVGIVPKFVLPRVYGGGQWTYL